MRSCGGKVEYIYCSESLQKEWLDVGNRSILLYLHNSSPPQLLIFSTPQLLISSTPSVELLEPNVGNDLCTDIIIKTLDELLPLHAEVSTQGGDAQADEERLVVDADVGGVAGNGLAGNGGPRLDEALLQ